LAVIVAAVCVSVFSGCTAKNKNMLKTDDGVFKYTTLDELESDWTLSTSSSASSTSTVFTMNYTESTSNYYVLVDTGDVGWAYIAQTVELSAGCYYKISYNVNVTAISAYTSGKSYDGVYATLLEDDDFNYDGGLMQTETCSGDYAVTFKAKESGKATLALRVGTEDHPVDATVKINSLTLARVSKSDATMNYAGTFSTDYYGGQSNFNIFYIVMGGVLIALLCYIGYFMFQRHLDKTGSEDKGYKGGFGLKLSDNKFLGIAIVAGIGLFIRILIDVLSTAMASTYSHTIMGYNVEGLATQALFVAKYGPQNLIKSLSAFATGNGYTYSAPSSSAVQLYFLGFAGLFGRIFESIGKQYIATIFFIRFFCALADVGTAIVLYNMFRKSVGNVGATVAASIYTVIPATFAAGALWGYTESVTALLIILAVAFMLDNKYIGTAVTYFAACMFSMSALFIAPVILFYTILQCIKDVKKIIPASIITVLAFFVFYAINVPFDLNYIQNGQPFYCFNKAWAELYTNAKYTLNAFNFQAMLGNNFGTISTSSLVVTIIFIVFMLTLVGVAYFKFKNRMNLMLLATAFIVMTFVFCNNMSPVSMYISLALMLAYAILNKEKRIYFSFVMFAVLMFVNMAYAELFIPYTSTAVGQMTANAVTYVFASFELVAALYYICVVYDIVVSRKVRRIKAMPMTYGEWLDNFFKRIKKGYYKLLIRMQKKSD
jgi:Gpi18-like mannosyltransferase